MKKYGILGAGAWGSAISTLISSGEINIWTRNKKIVQSINNKKTVIEGYYTSKALFNLSKKYKIEMPISKSIYKILYKKANINNEIELILNRSIKKEFY